MNNNFNNNCLNMSVDLMSNLNLNNDTKPKKETIDILSCAALKYADLLPFRTTDYVFDVEKFYSFDGKTGPYVLYSMVRIKSILDKSDKKDYKIKMICSDTQWSIFIKLLELSRVLNKSYSEKSLSYICEYLFEICSLFNKFYGECNILNEKDEDKKETYLALLNLIYNTCSKLIDVLAIKIPKKM